MNESKIYASVNVLPLHPELRERYLKLFTLCCTWLDWNHMTHSRAAYRSMLDGMRVEFALMVHQDMRREVSYALPLIYAIARNNRLSMSQEVYSDAPQNCPITTDWIFEFRHFSIENPS